MSIKAAIIKIVNEHQGIKAVDLVVEVSQSIFPEPMDEFEAALIEAIEEGDVVEVEYTLPHMDYRVKSMYLPKDTMVQVTEKAS